MYEEDLKIEAGVKGLQIRFFFVWMGCSFRRKKITNNIQESLSLGANTFEWIMQN